MLKNHILACCCLLGLLLIPATAFSSLVGQQLPSFQATDLNDKPVDLDKFIGSKPIMLVFWTSWCSDCIEHIQAVNELVKKYGEKDIEFIGINVGLSDTVEKARKFIIENKMTYPNVFDSTRDDLGKKYRLKKAFATILVNRKGTVMLQYYKVPQIDDQIIEMLNTYVHKQFDKTPVENPQEKQKQSLEEKPAGASAEKSD